MIQIENDCVDCGLPCADCGRKRAKHYYCDKCGNEADTYYFDGKELCIDCIRECLEKVE